MSPWTTTTSTGALLFCVAPNVSAARQSPPPNTWVAIGASGGQDPCATPVVRSAATATLRTTDRIMPQDLRGLPRSHGLVYPAEDQRQADAPAAVDQQAEQ